MKSNTLCSFFSPSSFFSSSLSSLLFSPLNRPYLTYYYTKLGSNNPYAALSKPRTTPITQREEPKPKKDLALAKDASKINVPKVHFYIAYLFSHNQRKEKKFF